MKYFASPSCRSDRKLVKGEENHRREDFWTFLAKIGGMAKGFRSFWDMASIFVNPMSYPFFFNSEYRNSRGFGETLAVCSVSCYTFCNSSSRQDMELSLIKGLVKVVQLLWRIIKLL